MKEFNDKVQYVLKNRTQELKDEINNIFKKTFEDHNKKMKDLDLKYQLEQDDIKKRKYSIKEVLSMILRK